nr:AI-2E family transporter [Zoogloeaceae bacterium]
MIEDFRFNNFVYGVALTLMLGYILFIGRPIFVPVVTSILIVYVIIGVSRLSGFIPLVGKRIPIHVRYILAAIVITALLMELSALFVGNLATIVTRAPEFQENLLNTLQTGATHVGIESTLTWETIRRDALGEINLQRLIRTGFVSIAGLLGALVFVLLNVTFLLLEQRTFHYKLSSLSEDPDKTRRLLKVIGDINARVGRYLAVKTMINVVLGLISWVIMAAMGLEFAVFWAIIIGLINYIPYVGTFIGLAFPVALALIQFDDLNSVLVLLVLLSAAQALMGYIVEPQVMGNSLNISPYVILISLTAWSSLWGIAGAIFAVPIAAVMVIVFSEFERTRPIAILLSMNGQIPERSM